MTARVKWVTVIFIACTLEVVYIVFVVISLLLWLAETIFDCLSENQPSSHFQICMSLQCKLVGRTYRVDICRNSRYIISVSLLKIWAVCIKILWTFNWAKSEVWIRLVFAQTVTYILFIPLIVTSSFSTQKVTNISLLPD